MACIVACGEVLFEGTLLLEKESSLGAKNHDGPSSDTGSTNSLIFISFKPIPETLDVSKDHSCTP